MASDKSDCELPDLEPSSAEIDLDLYHDYETKHSSSVSTLLRVRSDFYSDSSDVELDHVTKSSSVISSSNRSSATNFSTDRRGNYVSSQDSLNYNPFSASGGTSNTYSQNDEEPSGLNSVKVLKDASESSVEQFRSSTYRGNRMAQASGNPENMKELPSKQRKLVDQQTKQQEKELQKAEKEKQKQLKLQQKQQAEFEKSKKRLLQETIKNSRPGECLKHLTVVIDNSVLTSSCGPAVVKCLQASDTRYEVEKQPVSNMISFWRAVTTATEVEPNRLETKTNEVIEDEILIYVPLDKFIEMVDNFQKSKLHDVPSDSCTLNGFIQNAKSLLENRNVTLIVQGLENYFRLSNLANKRSFKNRVMEVTGDNVPKRKRKAAEATDATISRVLVEEAALVAQLTSATCIKFLESDEEVAKLVMQYSKSVAEKLYKQSLSSRLNSGYSGIFVEGCRGGIRVGSDGQGLARVWCQQLQQFKNVSAEVANAIVTHYPSPRSLIEAYQLCKSENEAERLLEDIVVRRGAGIVSTARRVGKELSRRLYILMTSTDRNQIIN